MTEHPQPTRGPWTLRRDERGYAAAIERNGRTVLHLLAGTERNENKENGAAWVVDMLNKGDDHGD